MIDDDINVRFPVKYALDESFSLDNLGVLVRASAHVINTGAHASKQEMVNVYGAAFGEKYEKAVEKFHKLLEED